LNEEIFILGALGSYGEGELEELLIKIILIEQIANPIIQRECKSLNIGKR